MCYILARGDKDIFAPSRTIYVPPPQPTDEEISAALQRFRIQITLPGETEGFEMVQGRV